MTVPARVVSYQFSFADGHREVTELSLAADTLQLISERSTSEQSWTRLEHEQCRNCPLNSAESPHCPVALQLEPVVETFATRVSHETVDVRIECEDRVYLKKLPLAEGLSSLVGMIMVTSGCPVMDQLRPMVNTHLPFATCEETTFRAFQMMLMGQYFRVRNGEPVGDPKAELVELYGEIRKVNANFKDRLQSAETRDANVTALINLDNYAFMLSADILEEFLDELEPLVAPLTQTRLPRAV